LEAVRESKRILVVDDDPPVRRTVAEALAYDGYEVPTAANGAEALELLRHYRAHAVILDLMMPVMNGFAFLDACRKEAFCASLPILALSAAPEMLEISGPAVRKPFDLERLLSTVARLIA
jgi:CheY-like chemotaxis protein